MAPGGHPGPATIQQDAPAQPAVTGARRVALFASGLQRSDTPTPTMAAEAITAALRQFGSHGCLSRMAQEFGDHPDTAAERMRWICQLTTRMSARPHMPAAASRASSRSSNDIQASSDHYRVPARGAA